MAHFERSLALNPGAPATHFNLGTALTVAGRLDEAVVQYREALRLRPDYAQAHNNLSGILLQRGQLAEAVSHIAEARRLDPANVEARNNAALAVRLAERAAQESGGTDPAANAVLTAARAALALTVAGFGLRTPGSRGSRLAPACLSPTSRPGLSA